MPTATARTAGPTLTVGLVAGALIACSLPVFLLSALSTRIGAELVLNEAALGLAVSAFFLAAALASLPAGMLADRFGASVALRTGLVIVAAGGLGVALTATGGPSLAAWLVVAGASIGFVDTGGARAIAAVVPVSRHGIAFGAKEASIPAASLVAGASVPILGAQVGWRPAFVGAAVLAVLLGLSLPAALDRSDRASRAREAGRNVEAADASALGGHAAAPSHAVDPSTVDAAAYPEPPGSPGDAPAADGQRSTALVALAATAALGGGAAMAGATFLAPSTVTYGWGEAAAGLLLAGASVAGIVVRLLVGTLADRRGDGELWILAGAIVIGAVGALGLATGSVAIAVPAAVLLMGGGWGWTGLLFLAAVRTAPGVPARAAGTVLVGLGIGGAGGPLSFGWLAGSVGYRSAWLVAAAAMAIGAGLALTAHRVRRRSLRHP